jgi:hypothetical protein
VSTPQSSVRSVCHDIGWIILGCASCQKNRCSYTSSPIAVPAVWPRHRVCRTTRENPMRKKSVSQDRKNSRSRRAIGKPESSVSAAALQQRSRHPREEQTGGGETHQKPTSPEEFLSTNQGLPPGEPLNRPNSRHGYNDCATWLLTDSSVGMWQRGIEID